MWYPVKTVTMDTGNGVLDKKPAGLSNNARGSRMKIKHTLFNFFEPREIVFIATHC